MTNQSVRAVPDGLSQAEPVSRLARPIPRLTGDQLSLFWSKVERRGPDDCWPWTGKPDHNGYGAFCIERVSYRAHRVSVSVAGYAVPRWSVIDHICRNRMCVNPAHLRTVLRGTNIFENSEAPAYLNSIKTHCPKGHPYSGANLVRRLSGRRGCRACENAYQRRHRKELAHG